MGLYPNPQPPGQVPNVTDKPKQQPDGQPAPAPPATANLRPPPAAQPFLPPQPPQQAPPPDSAPPPAPPVQGGGEVLPPPAPPVYGQPGQTPGVKPGMPPPGPTGIRTPPPGQMPPPGQVPWGGIRPGLTPQPPQRGNSFAPPPIFGGALTAPPTPAQTPGQDQQKRQVVPPQQGRR